MMARPPRSLREHVIDRALLLRAYAIQGAVEGIAAMAAFYFYYWTNGYWGQWLDLPGTGPIYLSAAAMALGAVVCGQIGNLFAHRSQTVSAFRIPFFNNRLIWIGIGVELLSTASDDLPAFPAADLRYGPFRLALLVLPLHLGTRRPFGRRSAGTAHST